MHVLIFQNQKKENQFGWAFEEKSQSGPKVVSDNVRTSSESSTSEKSIFSTSNSDSSSFKRKSSLSVKHIASPLHTCGQKRAIILRNDSLTRKCARFDSRFQNVNIMDGLQEGLIPRIKDSSRVKNKMNVTMNDDASKLEGMCRPSKENKMPDTGFYHSSNGTDFKKVRSDSYVNAILEENRIHYETNLKRKCGSIVHKGVDTAVNMNLEQKYCRSKSPEHSRSVHSSVKETPVKSNYRNVYKNPLGSSEYLGEVIEAEDPEITRLKLQTLQELKKRVQKERSGSKETVIHCRRNEDLEEEHKEKTDFKSSTREQSPREIPEESSHSKEILSPGEVFEPRTNSNMANEYPYSKQISSLPASIRHYSPFYPKPLDLRIGEKMNHEKEMIRSVRSNAINYSPSEIMIKKQFQASGGQVHSYDERNIEATEQDYPNVSIYTEFSIIPPVISYIYSKYTFLFNVK